MFSLYLRESPLSGSAVSNPENETPSEFINVNEIRSSPATSHSCNDRTVVIAN